MIFMQTDLTIHCFAFGTDQFIYLTLQYFSTVRPKLFVIYTEQNLFSGFISFSFFYLKNMNLLYYLEDNIYFTVLRETN